MSEQKILVGGSEDLWPSRLELLQQALEATQKIQNELPCLGLLCPGYHEQNKCKHLLKNTLFPACSVGYLHRFWVCCGHRH